jgi:hypothetical protein
MLNCGLNSLLQQDLADGIWRTVRVMVHDFSSSNGGDKVSGSLTIHQVKTGLLELAYPTA